MEQTNSSSLIVEYRGGEEMKVLEFTTQRRSGVSAAKITTITMNEGSQEKAQEDERRPAAMHPIEI